MAKFLRRPGRKTEVLVSQQAAMLFVCVSDALMHSIKILLSDMEWGGIQTGRDLHKTQLPPKVSALPCFSYTFSHLCSAAIAHHPRPTTNIQDRMKVPSCAHCQAHKEGQEETHYHIQKPPPSPGAATSTSHPCLVFFPDKEAGKYSPFSRSPDKKTCSLGHPPCTGLFPLPLLPFLLHIAHVSHQMSYQRLQQMHSLTSAREKATRIQSCNFLIICNELMGKYFSWLESLVISWLLWVESGWPPLFSQP